MLALRLPPAIEKRLSALAKKTGCTRSVSADRGYRRYGRSPKIGMHMIAKASASTGMMSRGFTMGHLFALPRSAARFMQAVARRDDVQDGSANRLR